MAKTIQWFPGHMTKAMRDMEEKRALCDGVICVLDARAPAATLNKNLKKVFGEKPVLYLLNKSDLADEGADGFVRLAEEKVGSVSAAIRRSFLPAARSCKN